MSFVTIGAIAGATTAAVSIGGKVAQGVAAQGVDSQGAVDSAANLSMAERVQMGNENKLQLNKISMKSKSMMDSATTKGRGSMMEVFKTQDLMGRSGFEGNDDQSADNFKEQVYSQQKSTVDSIVADSEVSKKAVSLSSLKQSADIEKRLQSNITAATSQADTFWEGFGGQGDYKVG